MMRDSVAMDEAERKQLLLIRNEIRENAHGWSKLSPRERDVLRLRVGLDDDQMRDYSSIASLFGIALTRIVLLEEKALKKLRKFGDPGADGSGVPKTPKRPDDLGNLVFRKIP